MMKMTKGSSNEPAPRVTDDSLDDSAHNGQGYPSAEVLDKMTDYQRAETKRIKAETRKAKQEAKNQRMREMLPLIRVFLKRLPIIAPIVLITGFITVAFVIPRLHRNPENRYFAESDLMKAVNVSRVSSVDYRYRGIAEKSGWIFGNRQYCVQYVAHVNASFNISNLEFSVDHDKGTITVLIPKPKIETQLEEDKFKFLPDNPNGKIADVIHICKNDAEEEIKREGNVIEMAYDSMEDTIEWLIYPIVGNDYKIRFKRK